MRKGVSSLLSMVMYAAMLIAAITIAVNVALPILDRMQDSSAIHGNINFLTGLDEVVREVASGSEGAARTVTLTFQRGSYHFDNDTEEIYYEIDTESRIISTHAVQERGPVTLSADADVSVTETTVNGTDCYMMENQHLKACIRKIPEEFNASAHTSLVGFWQLDEGSGQWANDSSQSGNDATLGNDLSSDGTDPSWVPGVHGNGLSFDTSQLVNSSDAETLDVTGNITLSTWVNATGTQTGKIVRKGGDYGLWANSSLAAFQVENQNVTASIGSGWVHVLGSYNGTGQDIYVDGKRSKTLSLTVSPPANADDLVMGTGFNGSIDSVRVYNRSLDQGEVEWLYLQSGDTSYVNTSEMLVQLRNKEIDEDLNASLSTFVNGNRSLRAGTGFTEADKGSSLGRGRVTLNVTSHGTSYKVAYDLLTGSDFLTLRSSGTPVENTTHSLDMVLDSRTGDDKYIDNEQKSEGLYTSDDIDFGYGVGESGGRVAGLVQGSSFQSVGFDSDAGGGRYGFNLSTGSSTALLPFTEGSHGVIEDRESAIQGSLFGSGNFLGFPSPNFAYALTDEKTVKAALSFENIVLNGFDRIINRGTYSITVSNEGVENGQAVVNLTVG